MVHTRHSRLVQSFRHLDALSVHSELVRLSWIVWVELGYRIRRFHPLQESVQKLVSFSIHESRRVVQVEALVVFEQLRLNVLQRCCIVFLVF